MPLGSLPHPTPPPQLAPAWGTVSGHRGPWSCATPRTGLTQVSPFLPPTYFSKLQSSNRLQKSLILQRKHMEMLTWIQIEGKPRKENKGKEKALHGFTSGSSVYSLLHGAPAPVPKGFLWGASGASELLTHQFPGASIFHGKCGSQEDAPPS